MRFCIVLILFIYLDANAQQTNVWRFGNGAGINFNTNPPTAMQVGPMNTFEPAASICDNQGNLLFYTNGNTVWDKNDQQMPNGSGLLAGNSTTQCIIIPKPLDCSKYYIFHAGDHQSPSTLRYTLVDMCLNNGNGDVDNVQKNILLYNSSSEKITAVKHNNGIDIWIVTHELGTNAFRSYLVTSNGVSNIPVITNIGNSYGANCFIGYMKASHNGQKIVAANSFCSLLDMFDFNNSTGVLTNFIDLENILGSDWYYGIEFSPNDQLLYLTTFWGNNKLLQVDLMNNYSTFQLGTAFGNYTYGGLQMGPDGIIYMAQTNLSQLGGILSPNISGIGANYQTNALTLSVGSTSQLGLINFIPWGMIDPVQPNITLGNDTTINCNFTPFNVQVPSICYSNYLWQDGSTQPNFIISNAGTYWLQTSSVCGIDIDTIIVTISPDSTAAIIGNTSVCSGEQFQLSATGGTTYEWITGSNSSSNVITVSQQMDSVLYTVVVSNDPSCPSDTVSVIVYTTDHSIASFTTSIEPCTDYVRFINQSTGSSAFLWDFGNGSFSTDSMPLHSFLDNGSYSVTLISGYNTNCADSISQTIILDGASASDVYIPNSFTPNNDGKNDYFEIYSATECVYNGLMIFNRWGELIYETNQPFTQFWDGTYLNAIAQEDIYVYRLVGDSTPDRYGTIALIK
jgi:gliding motility-associated-like protein